MESMHSGRDPGCMIFLRRPEIFHFFRFVGKKK